MIQETFVKWQVQNNPNEIGAGSHVDFGAVTLIYSDSPGLEVLDCFNQWKSVKHNVPGDAFIVNTG